MNDKMRFEKIKLKTDQHFDIELSFSLLKELIMDIRYNKNTSQHIDCIKEILNYWAELIGCAVDDELAEFMIDQLYRDGFISNIEQAYFWQNTHYRQG